MQYFWEPDTGVSDPRSTDNAQRATPIRGITLHQPYATLLVLGVKQYETRTWSTQHRGPLLIHAAAKQGGPMELVCEQLLRHPYFGPPILATNGMTFDRHRRYGAGQILQLFPRRAALGIVNVTDCVKASTIRDSLKPEEIEVGDFFEGPKSRFLRWAWRCENPIRFEAPIPCNGAQSMWIPDEALIQRVDESLVAMHREPLSDV